jgi:uncharacterized protein (DUF2267 family)
MLLEQSLWSSGNADKAADVDLYTFNRWATGGEAQTASAELEAILAFQGAGSDKDRSLEKRLVYGSKL